MLISLLILIAITLLAPPISFHKSFNKNYLDREAILPIKGFFVVLVFFSHFKSYVTLSDSFMDTSFARILGIIGQLMVAMFLFYSGYGIYTSFLKREDYIKTFLRRRFLPVWLSFAVCVVLFCIENLLLGEHYSLSDTLLAFTGWTTIGNSNWFMFVTFALYILVYISFRWQKNKQSKCGLITFTLLSLALLAILVFTKESWWYNTLLCFPLGMWYACYRERIDTFITAKASRWPTTLAILSVAITIMYLMYCRISLIYCAYSMIFTLLVVTVTMKFEIRCGILKFLGKHVFSMYMLQRLVFRALMATPVGNNNYLLLGVSAAVTVVVALAFDKVTGNHLTNFRKTL